jgi:hypothetical protein
MTSNIKSISSPTHPIAFEFGDSPKQVAFYLAMLILQAVVRLANEEGVPLGKDFEMMVVLAKPDESVGSYSWN